MHRLFILAVLLEAAILPDGRAAPQKAGHHPKVTVQGATRLDWTFVVFSQSRPPGTMQEVVDSTKQTYELFVPVYKKAQAGLPVILFISADGNPAGWKALEKLARAQGIFFASPHGAGNDCPPRKRARIVLDVLDDLRRNYPIDPDRTYVAGFSGGARIAQALGNALPELFGGIMPICAGGGLRDESWLRRRVADRLSVALLTGEKDFNRGEVEWLRGFYLKEVGVRSRVWVQPGLGHGLPHATTLAEAYRWLEDGLRHRRALARKYPASRLGPKGDSSRAALARALFAEGKKRLGEKGEVYAGLMQIKGVSQRWPDLPVGKQAQELLEEYDGKGDKSWEKDDLAEQRRFLIASARALTRYATSPLDARYEKMRPDMLRQGIKLWRQIAADQPESAIAREATKRIAALEKRLAE